MAPRRRRKTWIDEKSLVRQFRKHVQAAAAERSDIIVFMAYDRRRPPAVADETRVKFGPDVKVHLAVRVVQTLLAGIMKSAQDCLPAATPFLYRTFMTLHSVAFDFEQVTIALKRRKKKGKPPKVEQAQAVVSMPPVPETVSIQPKGSAWPRGPRWESPN